MNWNIDLTPLIKKYWRDICYISAALLLCLSAVLFPTKVVELRANLVLILLPIIAFALYWKRTTKPIAFSPPTKKLWVTIAVIGGVAVLLFSAGLYVSFNIFNQGTTIYAQSAAKVAVGILVAAIVLVLWLVWLLARNMTALPREIVAGYFLASGMFSTIVCAIGTLLNIADVPAEFPDIFKEQLGASLMHLVGSIGIVALIYGVILLVGRHVFYIKEK